MPQSLDDLTPITLTEFLNNFQFLNAGALHSYKLPEFFARNIITNINNYKIKECPIQLSGKKNPKIYYFIDGKWSSNSEKHFWILYRHIQKHYCGIFIDAKKKTNTFIDEADDNAKAENIDEVQYLIGKFFDVNKYPYARLTEQATAFMVSRMNCVSDE